jgi:hypothetical protein
MCGRVRVLWLCAVCCPRAPSGLADGAGVDFQTILRIHMIGELTQGDCSMYGAWGKATASTGKTFQLRALDWDVDGPFKNYAAGACVGTPLPVQSSRRPLAPMVTCPSVAWPLRDHPRAHPPLCFTGFAFPGLMSPLSPALFVPVVVYHPNSGNGHAFANVGFIGWVGALTGQSSAQMGISEIGVAFPDASFGAESRIGVPFTFLLRDILQVKCSDGLAAAADCLAHGPRLVCPSTPLFVVVFAPWRRLPCLTFSLSSSPLFPCSLSRLGRDALGPVRQHVPGAFPLRLCNVMGTLGLPPTPTPHPALRHAGIP